MLSELDEIFTCDAFPRPRRAYHIRREINGKLKDSLNYILEILQEVIDPGLMKEAADRLQMLDVTQKIPASYYMLNYFFVKQIERENLPALQEALSVLNTLPYSCSDHLEIFYLEQYPPLLREILFELAVFEAINSPRLHETDRALFEKNRQILQQALALTQQVATEIYDEACAFLSSAVFLKGDYMKAGSSSHALGLMFVEQNFAPTVEEMIDIFVHEAAHQYLHALAFEDALVCNPPEERYEAPLRPEKRPLIGIYHAVFVLARIIFTFQRLLDSSISEVNKDFIKERGERYKLRYTLGLKTLREHARLTPQGQAIMDSLPQLVA
jgi:hypothetical protein